MKNQINALVVDDNKDFTESVSKFFKGNESIKVDKVFEDGDHVVEYLKSHPEINIILMDLVLPKKDGMEILEELQSLGIRKHIILLTSYRKDYAIKMTCNFDIDYYMIKPCDLKSLEKRMKEVCLERTEGLYQEKKVNYEAQLKITNMLHELGVPSQLKGYQYLREGILMLYEKTGLVGGITKEVYPEIAIRYQTTPSRVERAIRHAIEISWNRANYEIMDKMFGHSIDYDRAKPTNSEFMVTLSDALRLESNRVRIYA